MQSKFVVTVCLFVGVATLFLVLGRHGSSRENVGKHISHYTAKYMFSLDQKPISTKSATAFVLFAVSDLNAQLIARDSAPSSARILRFAVWGGCVGAPLLHIWYNFLASFFSNHFALLSLWPQAALMSTVDQAFFFPIYASLYFLYAAWTTGGTHIDAFLQVRRELGPLLARATLYWVPLNTLNFALIPLKHRVLFVCVAALFWNTYFSFFCSRGENSVNAKSSLVDDDVDDSERQDFLQADSTTLRVDGDAHLRNPRSSDVADVP